MPGKMSPVRILLTSIFVAGLIGYAAPAAGANAASTSQIPGEGWADVEAPVPERATGPLLPMPATDLAAVKPAAAHTGDSGTTSSALVTRGTVPGVSILTASTDLAIFQNAPLAPTAPAPVPEELASPVFANDGEDVFGTYNKGAALSLDFGNSWFYIDPTLMQTGTGSSWEVHGGFAGSQDVIYDDGRDLMVWVLQYAPDSTGNAIRVAWATGNAAGLESNEWLSVALEPTPFCGGGGNANSRFDRVQLARTDNDVYLAANIYDSSAAFLCTTMIRIPLAALATGAFDPHVFYSHVGFNFTPAQGGTDTLYFARHESTTQLRVYDWPESVDPTVDPTGLTSTLVTHDAYVDTGFACPITSSTDPCGSDDDRLTTGWLRRDMNELGFMWDAAQDPGPTPAHPYPYVKIVSMDASTKGGVSQHEFANSSFAWFLASSSVNARGHVGGTLAKAGGSTYPGCNVWIYDDLGDLTAFQNLEAIAGTDAPASNHWGAYLRTRRGGLNPFQWMGACYAIESGVVTPRLVRFGRERDRYLPLKVDVDHDGTSDIGYYTPSDGVWSFLQSGSLFSYANPRFFSWGSSTDTPTPGDFDGDGRMDPTVVVPPSGGQSAAFRVLRSSTGYNYGLAWTIPAGWPGLVDTPVLADYNRDGITDAGIWRGSSGAWIIALSPTFTTYQFASWGMTGDKPIAEDVDGDGKADLGYFRPSTGVWGFLLSSQNYSYGSAQFFSWGASTDTPVMRDYDGDRKADPAFVTPPAGGQSAAYRILLSSTGYDYGMTMTVPAGWPGLGDTPVPRDYDRDGEADAAIWRASSGVWIIPKSSAGNSTYLFAQWGSSTDKVFP